MFQKVSDVKKAFTAFLRQKPFIVSDPSKPGQSVTIAPRFYKKSSVDYTEEQLQQMYPAVVLQDYTPKLDDRWRPSHKPVYGNIDAENSTGTMYFEPAFLAFRYDVSSASLHYIQHLELGDIFSRFLYNESVLLDPKDIGFDEYVGEPVQIKIEPQDIDRGDGVFETNYEFTFSAWVEIKDPEDVVLVNQLIIDVQSKAVN